MKYETGVAETRLVVNIYGDRGNPAEKRPLGRPRLWKEDCAIKNTEIVVIGTQRRAYTIMEDKDGRKDMLLEM